MQTITTIGLDIAKSVFPGITMRVLIVSTCMPPPLRPSGNARIDELERRLLGDAP